GRAEEPGEPQPRAPQEAVAFHLDALTTPARDRKLLRSHASTVTPPSATCLGASARRSEGAPRHPLALSIVHTIKTTTEAPQRVLPLSCIDGPGIVHAISGAVVAAGGNIAESQQFSSHDTACFFMRLQIEAVAQPERFEARFTDALTSVTE